MRLVPTLYVTTHDDKGTAHTFKLPVTETVPEGHEIVQVRQAQVARLSSILSPESVRNLLTSVK